MAVTSTYTIPVTKERVEPQEIQVNGYEATLPESDVAEAQKLFLSLSRENLLTFCGLQVAAELRLVKGYCREREKICSRASRAARVCS